MIRAFINGNNGTTGLRIVERLRERDDVELLTLPDEARKDVTAQAELGARADVTFLCLPDDASRALIETLGDANGRVLDTSTAFRTDARFAYGFPELSLAHASAVAAANRVAVPGCHASGCIALLYPLLREGIFAPNAPFSLTSLTGYTGGGKKMIAEYEAPDRDAALDSPCPYAVGQAHKHLPEIVSVCGLTEPPIFQPIVADYPCGMLVSLPIHPRLTCKPVTLNTLTALYRERYADQPLMTVLDPNPEPRVAANAMSGRDSMQVFLTGSDERMIACARFDNLGKGASGAAIECMNLMFGLPPTQGLTR